MRLVIAMPEATTTAAIDSETARLAPLEFYRTMAQMKRGETVTDAAREQVIRVYTEANYRGRGYEIDAARTIAADLGIF